MWNIILKINFYLFIQQVSGYNIIMVCYDLCSAWTKYFSM